MAALSTAKAVEVMFETALETHEHEMSLLEMTKVFKPNSADMQNSSNVVWRGVEQHAPIIEGWDTTGLQTGIIKQFYPATLEVPKNDEFELRADDMRDMTFWEERGKESGRKQASFLNQSLATLIRNTGSMFYRSNTASGYDFISEAQALMNERQLSKSGGRAYLLNDRDTRKFSLDLAGRQTLQGRPAETWNKGQIGSNVAEFDIYTGSYLGALAGGASPDTTVTSTQSFTPDGQATIGGVLQNVDYRVATIPVVASASYNVGDKISFSNVNALSLTDKTDTGQPMTFSVVGKPNATSLEIYPKPIALSDASLSVAQAAYANVNTQIVSGAVVSRLNIDTTASANLFWEKDSIEVVGGDAPLDLLSSYEGNLVKSTTKSGQVMYMIYSGNAKTLNFTCRLFTWWGLNNRNPSNNGVSVTY